MESADLAVPRSSPPPAACRWATSVFRDQRRVLRPFRPGAAQLHGRRGADPALSRPARRGRRRLRPLAAVLRAGATPAQVIEASGVIEDAGFTIIDDLLHGYGGGYLPPSSARRAGPRARFPDEPFQANQTGGDPAQRGHPRRKAGVQTGEMRADHQDRHRAHAFIPARICAGVEGETTMPSKRRIGDKLRVPEWYVSSYMMDRALEAVVRQIKKLDRRHDIPYLAGYSRNGKIIYIDRSMPKSFMYRGRRIKTDPFHPARGRGEDADRSPRPALPPRASDCNARRTGCRARLGSLPGRPMIVSCKPTSSGSAMSAWAMSLPISTSSPTGMKRMRRCCAGSRLRTGKGGCAWAFEPIACAIDARTHKGEE